MKKILLTVSLLLSTALIYTNAPAPFTNTLTGIQNDENEADTLLKKGQDEESDEEESQPSENDDKIVTITKQEIEEVKEALTSRFENFDIPLSIDIINKTERTVSVYGLSSPTAIPQLLATFQIAKPAQTVTIPPGIQAIYVGSADQSNTLSLVHGIQAVTISTQSSIGQYTYSIDALTPDYGDHVLVYNATDTSQSIQLQLHTTTPGILLNSNKDHNFAYNVPADTTTIITIPQFAPPTTQTKQANFGLKNSHQVITTDAHNSFVITIDNGTATTHKI